MLTIRKTQLDAMVAPNDDAMRDFAIRSLKQDSAEYVSGLPDEGLARMVDVGLRKARGYGLRAPEDLLTFVTLMFQVAPSFDRQADIRHILDDPAIAPENKLDLLTERRFDQAWDEAEEGYDPNAWNEQE